MMTLPQFWSMVIVIALVVYVVLDGFDLGIGVLLGMTDDEAHRRTILKTIEPVWDGNETWLVVIGATLYATFPIAYAIYLPAFYVGIVLMLLGLIFRGVGFQFRYHSVNSRLWWDRAIIIGSLVAAFVQGAAVGAITRGINVEHGQFAGGSLDWLSWFSVMAGLGCVVGYSMHGLAWLIVKTEGEIRDWAYARLPTFFVGWLAILAVLFWRELMGRSALLERWSTLSPLWIMPALGIVACAGLFYGIRRRHDFLPFAMTSFMFLIAITMFVFTLWPYMIPWTITMQEAAGPPESLSFMFAGGIIVMPVILIYTSVVYWVFRGKVSTG